MNGILRPLQALLAPIGAAAFVAASVAACFVTGNRAGGELESRYAAVHNALTAIGMSEVGTLHAIRLSEGQETRIALELAEGCTTIVAVGGASVTDLDAALLDALGNRIARGATHTSEATIRACTETAGSYALRLTASRGAGALIVSTWSGGTPLDAVGARGHEGAADRAFGTCEAPLPLSEGDFAGTTTHGEAQNESKGCQKTSAAELVYKLDVSARKRVTLAVETGSKFDSVLYVRKGDCTDADAEVACNDDAPPIEGGAPDRRHSRVAEVLDPGTYYVFVDGFNGSTGSFKLHVELEDVPPLAELCASAPLLADATPVNGTTEGAFDEASGSCGEGAHGPDSVYALVLRQRSRVRVTEHSDDFVPVVHLRSRCTDDTSAVGCADSAEADHEATFVGILDAGRYAIFADSSQREASGKFTLTAETAPESGAGTRGERCADAIPLSTSEHEVTGDTFTARDDVASQCGGTGAPDVVYRVDIPARTRLTAHLTHGGESHVLILLRGCTGAKAELECGKSVERVLAPGSYFLAVDGESPVGFGAFAFEWSSHDTHAQEAACNAPPILREGETVAGTTLAGAVDKFSPSCVSSDPADSGGGAPDVVYKLVIANRHRVRLRLHSPGWDSVLSVRRACVEGDTAAVTASEVECHADTSNSSEVEFDSVLNAGTYSVIVDGRTRLSAGPFTMEAFGGH